MLLSVIVLTVSCVQIMAGIAAGMWLRRDRGPQQQEQVSSPVAQVLEPDLHAENPAEAGSAARVQDAPDAPKGRLSLRRRRRTHGTVG